MLKNKENGWQESPINVYIKTKHEIEQEVTSSYEKSIFWQNLNLYWLFTDAFCDDTPNEYGEDEYDEDEY